MRRAGVAGLRPRHASLRAVELTAPDGRTNYPVSTAFPSLRRSRDRTGSAHVSPIQTAPASPGAGAAHGLPGGKTRLTTARGAADRSRLSPLVGALG
jgi:hypothetical protein